MTSVRKLLLPATILLGAAACMNAATLSVDITYSTDGKGLVAGPANSVYNDTGIITSSSGASVTGAGASYITVSDLTTGCAAGNGGVANADFVSIVGSFPAVGYLQFTLTAASGYTIDLNSVGFDYLVRLGSASYSTYAWQYQVDGGEWMDFTGASSSSSTHAGGVVPFSTGLNGGTSLAGYTGNGKVPNPVQTTESSLAANSLNIRFSPSQNYGGGALIFEDVKISASVTPVPEPSTYALAGGILVVGIALATRRRKRA